MAHDAGHGGVRAVPPGDPRPEAFLRMLAERELRWVVTEPDLPPPGAGLPAGRPVPFPGDGDQDRRLHLLTVTLAPELAVLSYAGRVPDPGQLRDPRHLRPPGRLPPGPIGPLGPASVSGHLTFSDDRGARYQAHAHGGFSTDGTWWSGAFRLSPALPADARWVDITSGAGTIRIGLADSPAAGPPPAVPGHRQIPAWDGALPPAGGPPAERLLDLLAEDLLWSVLWTGDGGQAQSELATMISALGSAGVIEPGSPALARLITLARQLDIDLPHGSPAVSPADLPQAWTGALGARDRRDGHDGLTPAAAVLPETDGAVFAITGLHSTGQAVILRALAWGWVPARTRFPRTGQRYSWTALDDAGRWHIARQIGGPIGGADGHGLTDIALIPPLHPAATSLDIILTGPTTQANATVPLRWQPLR